MARCLFFTLLITFFPFGYTGQMYKYEDENGNLVYSDKPPIREKSFEELTYEKTKKSTPRIKLRYLKKQTGYTAIAKNTFFAPIEIEVTNPETQEKVIKVIPARGDGVLFQTAKKSKNLSYRWALGDPNSVADNYSYHAPFPYPNENRITQAFNGKFSHTNDYNKFAVDIAMDLGSSLTAVRDGTVVWVKDDYHMSGTTKYFLDKANAIKILHDDGTFALYAHILMDTALVKEGDKVKRGDRIARSGSSGFSTGPHLHFVIVKNVGLKIVAIPFKFLDDNGTSFTPKQAMVMVGATNP